MMELILRVMAVNPSDLPAVQNLPNVEPNNLLQSILNYAYFGIGIVAVVIIVTAGIQYVTGQGEPEKVKTAHRTITYAVIGLIVVLLAAAITNFVVGNVG
jgi:type IV secretory pathway VirB2 component (pilin)